MRVFAISLVISARVARVCPMFFDFFWVILASCHAANGKNGQYRPVFSEAHYFDDRRTHSGTQEEALARIGRGKVLRSVVTTSTPRLTRDDHRAAMASVAGIRVAAFN